MKKQKKMKGLGKLKVKTANSAFLNCFTVECKTHRLSPPNYPLTNRGPVIVDEPENVLVLEVEHVEVVVREAVRVQVGVTLRLVVGVGVAVGVQLPESERLPDQVGVGTAERLGVGDAVSDGDPVAVPLGLPVWVCASVIVQEGDHVRARSPSPPKPP